MYVAGITIYHGSKGLITQGDSPGRKVAFYTVGS